MEEEDCPKTRIFSGFFGFPRFRVARIRKRWNPCIAPSLVLTTLSCVRSTAVFPGFFQTFPDPADATNSTRAAVRATTARLASRRQSVEPRRCEKGFSATPNDGPSQPGGPRAAHALRGRRDGKSAVARCLGRTNNAHAPAPALSSTSADWSAHAGLPRSTALAGLHLDALALASRSIVVHNH